MDDKNIISNTENEMAMMNMPFQDSGKVTRTVTEDDMMSMFNAFIETKTLDKDKVINECKDIIKEKDKEIDNLHKAIPNIVESYERKLQEKDEEISRILLESRFNPSTSLNIYEVYNFRPSWFSPSATNEQIYSFVQTIKKLLEKKYGDGDYLLDEKVCCCIVYHILTSYLPLKNFMMFISDQQDFPVFWNEMVEKTITDDIRREKLKLSPQTFKDYLNPKKRYEEIMGNNPKSWKRILINGKSRSVKILRLAVDIFETMKALFHVN